MKDLPELPERYFWHKEDDGDIAILYNHNHPAPPPEKIQLARGAGIEVVARATAEWHVMYYGFGPNAEWAELFDSQEEAITALYGRFLIGEWT
jgi:hypothetical protein